MLVRVQLYPLETLEDLVVAKALTLSLTYARTTGLSQLDKHLYDEMRGSVGTSIPVAILPSQCWAPVVIKCRIIECFNVTVSYCRTVVARRPNVVIRGEEDPFLCKEKGEPPGDRLNGSVSIV